MHDYIERIDAIMADPSSVEPIEAPAEVWCSRCPEPTESVVDGEPYCHEHTLDALWRRNSKSWAGSPERTR